jgi:hypothetical protein
MEYWIHQVKLGRSDMEDERKRGRLPLGDFDATIIAFLGHEPLSRVRSPTEAWDWCLPHVIDTSPYRWICNLGASNGPHMLTRELKDQRVKGSRGFFDAIRQQEKTQCQGIIAGDASWRFIDRAASSIWLWLDEDLPTCPRRIISPDKHLLVAFWGIKGLVHVNYLPKDARITAVYLRDDILIPIVQKRQTNACGGHRPWTLIAVDNAKVHTVKVVPTLMPDLRLKSTFRPLYSPDICLSDLLIFGWLKGKPQPPQFTHAHQFFEVIDAIAAQLSIETIL